MYKVGDRVSYKPTQVYSGRGVIKRISGSYENEINTYLSQENIESRTHQDVFLHIQDDNGPMIGFSSAELNKEKD